MKQVKIWQSVSLSIVLGLVVAAAASGSTTQQAQRPPGMIAIPGSHDHWLGIIVKDVNKASAKELKLSGDYGAIVVSVFPDSPAAKAGIRKNDVILEFATWRVWSAAQLQRLVKETPAGRTVKIQIIRQGKLQTLQVKLEPQGPNAFLGIPGYPNYRIWRWPAYKLPLQREQPEGPWVWQGPFYAPPKTPHQQPLPEAPRIAPLPPIIPKFKSGPLPNPEVPETPHLWVFPKPGPRGEVRPYLRQRPAREDALGISGQNLTPQLARFFGVKEGQGILVSQVDKGSPASAAGLKAGDVIVRLGSQEVSSMAELQWLLQSQPNRRRRVTLGIVRNHEERQMSVLLNPDHLTPRQHGVRPEPIMARRSQ